MEKFIENYLFTESGRRKVRRLLERVIYVGAPIFIAVMVAALLLR